MNAYVGESVTDPLKYYFDSLAATAALSAGQYQRALQLAERSMRLNRTHTSTLRAMITALWHLERQNEARAVAADLMRIEAEWQQHVLAPVVAANLTVEPLSDVAERVLPDSRLSSLPLGQQATVVDLSPACRGPERRRLLDLGVVPGTVIRAELASTGGDPIAYRIRGAMIALRNAQADLIHVKMQTDAAAQEAKG